MAAKNDKTPINQLNDAVMGYDAGDRLKAAI